MAQATYSIRLDEDKKAEFDEICSRLGLSASAAFSTFVNKTIESHGLPYELKLAPSPSDYGAVDADNLSREELIVEIQKGIDSAKSGKYTLREVVAEIFGENRENI